MDIGKAKVPFVLFAGNSHPELANLIAEYVCTRNNVCMLTEILQPRRLQNGLPPPVLGLWSGSPLFLHGVCMLRECIYGECAHEQHVRRTLTLTLTHTITAVLSKWKCTCAHTLLCN